MRPASARRITPAGQVGGENLISPRDHSRKLRTYWTWGTSKKVARGKNARREAGIAASQGCATEERQPRLERLRNEGLSAHFLADSFGDGGGKAVYALLVGGFHHHTG